MYIADIEEAVSKIAAEPFNPETFPYDFIAAYDAPPATVTRIRNGSQNATDLEGGLLWRQKLHLLVCKPGQVEASLQQLVASRATERQKAQFLLATDGIEVAARDLRADDATFFSFEQFGDHFGFFLPLAGYSRYKAAEENPIDVKAANRLRKLYDALIAENPDWAGDDKRHAMNTFMTRLIFCMFAEDTGIFAENLFAKTIHKHGGHAGEEMVHVLTALFTAMSQRPEDRAGLPTWADKFPWVNGGLFTSDIEVPRFSRTAYRTLTEAAGLRWNEINADIFGSMIQVIVDPSHRHEIGMHYTSVPNILKALDPLFLDDLRAEASKPALADASREKARLKALLNRLSKIRVFDPACGSGNFLVIAYQELRKIERQVLDRLQAITGQAPGIWSHIELHNFYGIELSDFAAETAKLSLWIAKFQMDRAQRDVFGTAPPALPLSDSGNIVCDNSLKLDWLTVCPPPTITRNRQKIFDLATIADVQGNETLVDQDVETYIVGNPPYLGKGKKEESHLADMEHIFRRRIDQWGYIDYVGAWFVLAGDYLRKVRAKFGLVATNSVNQGRQLPQLWPLVLGDDLAILFAHTSFKWTNNAATNAGVICVIIGVGPKNSEFHPIIFDDGHAKSARSINPYLIDGPTIFVQSSSRPLFPQLPRMITGSVPNDGGNLIFEPDERDRLLARHPEAAALFNRFGGSKDVIQGLERYCLLIGDNQLGLAEGIPEIAQRLERVRQERLVSKKREAREILSATPHRFQHFAAQSQDHTIVIPSVCSENREYFPVDLLDASYVVSNLAFMIPDGPLWTLALLSSRLHMVWLSTVCGKLKSDYRYSNTLGWHTFPVPRLSNVDQDRLSTAAENILIARAEHGGTLATLYAPDKMPASLRQAHVENDALIEKIYSDRPFRSDADRLSHLFRRYSRMAGAGDTSSTEPEFDLEFED